MATDPNAAREAQKSSVSNLVSGIVSDTGDLLGAHVDSIRNEIKEGLGDLRDRLQAFVVAAVVGLLAAIIIAFALGFTLVRLGLPTWAAFWIVGGVLLAVSAGFILRARKASIDADPGRALRRAKKDATWLADRAGDAVT